MPIYEYRCGSCGRLFEVIQKFSDEPLTSDPECGKGPVERLISAPAFQFKGTGFYITDYAKGKDGGAKNPTASTSSSDSKSSDSSSGSNSDTSSSTDTKASESKSETKADTSSAATKTETKTASKE